jgi:cation diffusion facilitator CzcD-associated flavoprotein CzcO
MVRATVVVIGAGQAGLSAAYHLRRQGFVAAVGPAAAAATGSAAGDAAAAGAQRTFVVLDSEPGPGGAWQHRWRSLTMATVNEIFDLPGFPQPAVDPSEPSREAVPRYFTAFERRFELPILRPCRVSTVCRVNGDPAGELLVTTDRGSFTARAIVNATGTWTNPTLPHYPGQESFAGRQLHTRDYATKDEFVGQRVAVVGGGISAIQQLEEISRVATTFWYTRRPPVFLDGKFMPETTGRATVAKVAADVEAGRPTGSVVSYTGLFWTPYALAARARGALARRPMFTAIEPQGVRETNGSLTAVDTILWATGFKPALAHLAPLALQGALGGIAMRGTQVASEPRVHLVGFGPSQSTVGANRAGRAAVTALIKLLNVQDAARPDAGGRHATGH